LTKRMRELCHTKGVAGISRADRDGRITKERGRASTGRFEAKIHCVR
jgi:hypothetical protein